MPLTRQQFEQAFPSVIEDIKKHVKQTGLPESNYEWFAKVTFTQAIKTIDSAADSVTVPRVQLPRWQIQ